MKPIDEKNTTRLTCLPLLLPTSSEHSFDGSDIRCQTNTACIVGVSHSSQRIQVDSATAYFLEKTAYGLWSMMRSIAWDLGLLQGMDTQALEELHAILSSTISSYVDSALDAFHIVSEFISNGFSHNNRARDTCVHSEEDKAPPTSEDTYISDSSSCSCEESGLILEGTDDASNCHQRLEDIITQVDVSQMQRDDSQLDNDSIHQQLSMNTDTNSVNNEAQSICSSHKEDEGDDDDSNESVGDFLQRNSRIIEDYFDSSEYTIEPGCKTIEDQDNMNDNDDMKKSEQQLAFSWMMVPADQEDPMTRMSNSAIQLDVNSPYPTSTVCKSTDSAYIESNSNKKDTDNLGYCTICQSPIQDEEQLCVLVACEHRYHNDCIGKFLSEHGLGECPVCKEAQ